MAQKLLLLAASLFFYAFADLRFVPYVLYIYIVILIASLFSGIRARRGLFFALCVCFALLPLLFFKYSGTHLIFPLGLSFFTFQCVGYIADVWTRKIEAEKNPLDLALFVTFFPTVSSGPIQRAANLIPQFKEPRRFDYDNCADGMKLFAWGMFKKLVIADRIAVYVNYVYGNAAEQRGLALLLATLLYSFQIYCDFSGYSDMAIGAARFLSFDVGKNFDHPYLSQTVGEFWRRWHISLSSWLRDYVYIPLGGSRVATARIYLNLMITFLVSGIWHGSTWNFVIWGGLHGLLLCAERASKEIRDKAKIPAWINVAVTFCLVSFAWVFFRAQNLDSAVLVIKKIAFAPRELFQFMDIKSALGFKEAVRVLFELRSHTLGLEKMLRLLLTLLVFGMISFVTRKKPGLEIVRAKPFAIRWASYILLYAVIFDCLINSMESNKYTEFLYFSF